MYDVFRAAACCLIPSLMLSTCTPLIAERRGASHRTDNSKIHSSLTEDQKILHALNRLTFGPAPGDVEKVKDMGLEQWIDLQLSPEKIEDHALEARLADYPAMKLSLKDMLEQFPNNARIRAIAMGTQPLPREKSAKAIANVQVELYRQKQQKKAAQAPGSTASSDEDEMPSLRAQESRLYGDLKAVSIINLPPGQ